MRKDVTITTFFQGIMMLRTEKLAQSGKFAISRLLIRTLEHNEDNDIIQVSALWN